MKFKFETGEIIECFNEDIIKLLQADKRYEEVVDIPKKKVPKKVEKKEPKKGEE